MRVSLENRVSMYFKVREFFSNHLATLQVTAPALTPNLNTFNNQLDELGNLITLADTNQEGQATQKQNYRNEMQNQALAVSGALYALGKMNQDEPLAAKAYNTKTALGNLRDTDVLYTCERLLALANEHAANLVPLGIDAAKITAFGNAITAYKNAIQDPADARSQIKAANATAEIKSDEINQTLIITDALMLAISNDHNQLYLQYRADRLIDDNSASQSAPDIIEVVDAGTTLVLYTVPYNPSRSFKIKNTGTADIEWSLSENGTDPTEQWSSVGGGESKTYMSSTLATKGDMLIVRNSGSEAINVELSIIE